MKCRLFCVVGSLALLWGCDAGSIGMPGYGGRDAALEPDAAVGARDAAEPVPDAAPTADAAIQPQLDADVPDVTLPDSGAPDAAEPIPDAAPPEPPKPVVSFDPPGSGFSSPFLLTLTPGEDGALIHYTLDGSLPSKSSATASGPIMISATTLVRAVAVKDDLESAIWNQSYFQLDSSLQDFDSNLPLMIVHTLGGAAPVPSSRSYVPAMFGLWSSADRTQLEAAADLTSRLGIKIRGRSTRNQEKPSYTIELWGRDKEDAPATLLDMPEDGDWVLYAPFDFDRSMMHNVFAYDLSRKIGRYAPRTEYCELFVVAGSATVTMAHYAGVYVLTERLTRSAARVDIAKLDPDEVTEPAITGGYIIKVDQPDMIGESFTAAGMTFVYVDPDADEIVPAQTQYITEYLDAVKRAIAATDGRDPQAGPTMGKHYGELIDVDSFIDHHILTMLLKNPDAFALSSHFYKDRGGKLFAGPLWDFDLAMGTIETWGDRSLEPMYWGPNTGSGMFNRSFWGPLFEHDEFATAYWARWSQLLAGPFNAADFRSTVDALEARLSEAEARNHARWPWVGRVPTNRTTYPDEINFLRGWLDARLAWVSANLGVVP